MDDQPATVGADMSGWPLWRGVLRKCPWCPWCLEVPSLSVEVRFHVLSSIPVTGRFAPAIKLFCALSLGGMCC